MVDYEQVEEDILYATFSQGCTCDRLPGVWSKSLSQTSKSLGTRFDSSSSYLAPINLEGSVNTQTEASPPNSNANNDTDNDVEFLGNTQVEAEELLSGSSNKEKENKHKRRKKMDYGIEVMNKVANNIDNVAAALTMDVNRNFTKELYDEIMALDGYTNGMKSSAYDFLLRMGNESLARGFLSRNIEMRKVWMDEFLFGSDAGVTRIEVHFDN